MIDVKQLVRRFGPFTAVNGISFEVKAGEVIGFLGPNGAGKTTTIRVLTGYLPPSAGSVRVTDLDVVEESLEVRRRVGYLPENNPLYEELEVAEYLEWLAEIRNIPADDRTRAIRRAVEKCGLGDALGKPVGQLSKGYRQRVGLAQAILHDPAILFLDEPTSGLDPNQARDVRELIRELKREKTVFLSTHILPEVQAMCDRVLIIHRGNIVASGTPSELSAAASGQAKITLTLKADGLKPQDAAEALKRVPGVETVAPRRSDEGLAVEVTPEAGRDPREGIFKAVVEKRWTLLEMTRQGASLEEVFQQLTMTTAGPSPRPSAGPLPSGEGVSTK